jgi:predicted nucleotidyltransferase component of viral defense system
MRIPIANQLKRKRQVELASLQDEMIRIVYSVTYDSVLHGGTSIWRCYSGKRFSEDLDLYSLSFPDHINEFKKMIKAAGLIITKLEDTDNVIFSLITDGRVKVSIEVN